MLAVHTHSSMRKGVVDIASLVSAKVTVTK